MNFDPPRQWQPGADDSDEEGLHNPLERAMDRAGRDPGKHQAMWRALSKSKLHVLMPYHPEMEGEHQIREGEKLPIMHVMDEDGPFVPVFASHGRAVAAARALHQRCCVAALPSVAVFKTLAMEDVRIVINPHEGPRLSMQPDTVKAFAAGDLTNPGTPVGVPERVALAPLSFSDLPEELIECLRSFGKKHRGIIGIYVFNALDEKTQKSRKEDLRVLLWLRMANDKLYQELAVALSAVLPDGMRGGVALLDGTTPDAVDFVQKFKPLWPVLE
jgi:hypothetical protein